MSASAADKINSLDEELRKARSGGTVRDILRALGRLASALAFTHGPGQDESRAVDLLKERLGLAEQLEEAGDDEGPGHVQGTLKLLSEVTLAMGDYDEALKYLYQSVDRAFRNANDATDDEKVVLIGELMELGENLENVGRFADALGVYESIADVESAVHTQLPAQQVASIQRALARTYERSGKHAEAQGIMQKLVETERGLADDEASRKALHADVYNLACLTHSVENASASVPLYEEAIAIRVKMVGESHSSLADRYLELGKVLEEADRVAEAVDAYEKAKAIDEEIHGEDSLQVATDLNYMGTALFAAGEYQDALWAFDRAHAINLEHEDEVDVKTLMDDARNLAMTYERCGKGSEAISLFDELMNLHRGELKTHDGPYYDGADQFIDDLERYAACAQSIGSNERALELYGELCEKRRGEAEDKVTDADSAASLASALNNAAVIHLRLRKFDEALSKLQEAEKVAPHDFAERGLILFNRAKLHFANKRFGDAATEAQRAVEEVRAHLTSDAAPALRECGVDALRMAVRCYESLDKTDEVHQTILQLYAFLEEALVDPFVARREPIESEKDLPPADAEELKPARDACDAIVDMVAALHAEDVAEGQPLSKAADILTRVVFVQERVVGGHSPEIAKTFHQLSRVFVWCGELEDAVAMSDSACDIMRALLGSEHETVVLLDENSTKIRNAMEDVREIDGSMLGGDLDALVGDLDALDDAFTASAIEDMNLQDSNTDEESS